MNTNMTGFRGFSKFFASFCLDVSSLSIGRVNKEFKLYCSCIFHLYSQYVCMNSLYLC